MRPIAAGLEEARFVHLIRDGRDVALSRRARGMGADKPIADVAELWRRRIENARKQAKRLRGRYLELRYEDLVADPEPALRRVCELIELEYDPAMLTYHEAGRRADRRARRPRRPRGTARARPQDERQAAHALAAKPPTEQPGPRSGGREMTGRRARGVRGGGGPAARRSRLRPAILIGPRWLSTTRSECFATGACAAAPSPPFPAPFVVGVGRSGTTLLRLMLDAHPELAIPPETHFINPLIQASGRLRFNPNAATRTIVDDERRRWNDFGLDEEDLLARFQAGASRSTPPTRCAPSTSSTRPSTASTAGATRRRTTSAR